MTLGMTELLSASWQVRRCCATVMAAALLVIGDYGTESYISTLSGVSVSVVLGKCSSGDEAAALRKAIGLRFSCATGASSLKPITPPLALAQPLFHSIFAIFRMSWHRSSITRRRAALFTNTGYQIW